MLETAGLLPVVEFLRLESSTQDVLKLYFQSLALDLGLERLSLEFKPDFYRLSALSDAVPVSSGQRRQAYASVQTVEWCREQVSNVTDSQW